MTGPLVIACVKWGDQYSAYYVNTLCDMVRRHMPEGYAYEFQCFTDDPVGLLPEITARDLPGNLTGWWNKLYLFKEGMFVPDQRVVYFDLDTLIIGSLENIIGYKGDFAILRDFYRPYGYGSGVMLLRAGACDAIWLRFEEEGMPTLPGGDQTWIEITHPGADRLQNVFPGAFASFKTDCHPLPPAGTSVVCFHGEPKQDNCHALWVRDVWKPDGSYRPTTMTTRDELLVNAHHAATLPYPWVKQEQAHTRCAVIIGGGHTLDECREELLQDRVNGYDFFAINNAPAWLARNSIGFDAHVICSTQEQMVVPENIMQRYYASICHKAVLEAGENAVLWNPEESGGSTAGLQAIHLAHLLGYRNFQLYGFDCCCIGKAHHAYAQQQSDRDRIFTIELYGRKFRVAAWMLKQADEFIKLADTLLPQGCSITIHGDGLLHFLATREKENSGSTSSARKAL